MSSQNKNSKPFWIIAALSTLGALISCWQARAFFMTRSGIGELHPFCNIGATFDCTSVEMNRFAELWVGFPVSGIAIAGYLLILFLAFFGFNANLRNDIRRYLVFFSSTAVIFSAFYLFIMITVIGKLCLLCLTVDLINILLLFFSLRLAKADPLQNLSGPKFTQVAGAGVAAVLIAFLMTKGLNPQAALTQEDVKDMVESVLAGPTIQLNYPADSPVIGKPDAPITVVKFSDFQCPSCKLGALSIHPLMKRYADQVKFVFINYPLDMACNPQVNRKMHEFACEAARVAICAQAQGKFQDTYETLFDHQTEFAEGKIASLLSSIPGIDMNALNTCMAQPSTQEKIRTDVNFGTQLKIEATPTFYINGKKIEGGLPTSIWIDLIDRMLKK